MQVLIQNSCVIIIKLKLPRWIIGKESVCTQDTQVRSLGWEDLEKEMATHSSILAWEIPWTEEPAYSPWGH